MYKLSFLDVVLLLFLCYHFGPKRLREISKSRKARETYNVRYFSKPCWHRLCKGLNLWKFRVYYIVLCWLFIIEILSSNASYLKNNNKGKPSSKDVPILWRQTILVLMIRTVAVAAILTGIRLIPVVVVLVHSHVGSKVWCVEYLCEE